MNSQLVLYIQIFLGIAFVLYFLLSRGKSRQPTQLNVKANEDFSKSNVRSQKSHVGAENTLENEDKKVEKKPEKKPEKKSEFTKMTVLEPENIIQLKDYRPQAKNLSIYFIYNGHEWEAHEVLGVPAGASMPKVTEAYQKLIITSDPSTFEFFESAYQAVLKKWRDRL